MRKQCVAILVMITLLTSSTLPSLSARTDDIEVQLTKIIIQEWIDTARSGGAFSEHPYLTRGEFVFLVNKAFGFEKTSEWQLRDVSSGDDIYSHVSKALAQGYIIGDENGYFNGENKITRQEIAVILGRILKLEPTGAAAGIFVDSHLMPEWSRGYIGAVYREGIISGYPDRSFKFSESASLTEAVDMLARTIGRLYNQERLSDTVEETGQQQIQSNVTINTSGAIVKNLVIDGDLYLTEGIGDGTVILDNVTVKGKTLISGGGEHSVIVRNSTLQYVIVDVPDHARVRVVAEGTTAIDGVLLKSPAIIEERNLSGEGFIDLVVDGQGSFDVKLTGNFQTVELNSAHIKLDLGEGIIARLILNGENAGVTIAAAAEVEELIIHCQATIAGEGKIVLARIGADQVVIQQIPQTYVFFNRIQQVRIGGTIVENPPAPTPQPTPTPSTSPEPSPSPSTEPTPTPEQPVTLVNLALNESGIDYPTVSASYTFRFDSVLTVNNGIKSFTAVPHDRWTAYESPNAEDWIEVDFGTARIVSQVKLYWYDDGGGVQLPADYKVQYWDGDTWLDAENQLKTPLQPVAEQENTAEFTEIETTKVRVLIIHRADAKAGVTELEVYGYPPAPVLTNVALNENGADYPVASASYTWRFDTVQSINNGVISYTDSPRDRWTNWETPNEEDWLEIDFGADTSVSSVKLYLYSDGGGVLAPADYRVQYWDGSQWREAEDQVKEPLEPTAEQVNIVSFTEVSTTKLRVVLTNTAHAKVGVTELEIYGYASSSSPSEPGENIALNVHGRGYYPKPSASYSNGSDSPLYVNNGIVSYNNSPRDRWTAYGSPDDSDWLELDFSKDVAVHTVRLALYDDGGGVQVPASYDIQYWDGSQWQDVESQVKTPPEPRGQVRNTVVFDKVVTDKLRVVFTHQAGSQSGVTELEVYGVYVDGTPPEAKLFDYPVYQVSVVNPVYRSEINGLTTIELYAPLMKSVEASIWRQPDEQNSNPFGHQKVFAVIEPDEEGYATVAFDADDYPHGPLMVMLRASDAEYGQPAIEYTDTGYLQLYNLGGVQWGAGLANAPQPVQAAGMELVFMDDFDAMPTISYDGIGTTYSSRKPDDTEYGEAIFADYEGEYNPFSQIDTYLKITEIAPESPHLACPALAVG